MAFNTEEMLDKSLYFPIDRIKYETKHQKKDINVKLQRLKANF